MLAGTAFVETFGRFSLGALRKLEIDLFLERVHLVNPHDDMVAEFDHPASAAASELPT